MTAAVIAAAVVLLGAAGCHALLVRAVGREVTGRFIDGTLPPRWPAPALLRVAVDGAAIPVDADVAWVAWLSAGLALPVVAAVFGGVGLALVALVAVIGTPAAVLAALRGRAARQVDGALPEVLDGVARSLRSGAAIGQALEECRDVASGRLGADIGVVVDDAGNGAPLTQALDGWTVRCPTPGVRLTVASIALAAESGGAAARAVDGVAATLRANLALAAEVRAQAAQARFSALVIAVSPVAFGALAAGTDRQTADFLLRTPIGLLCLVAGLSLDAAAAFWMHRITEGPA